MAKRLIACIIALSMIFMTACGDSSSTADSSKTESSSLAETTTTTSQSETESTTTTTTETTTTTHETTATTKQTTETTTTTVESTAATTTSQVTTASTTAATTKPATKVTTKATTKAIERTPYKKRSSWPRERKPGDLRSRGTKEDQALYVAKDIVDEAKYYAGKDKEYLKELLGKDYSYEMSVVVVAMRIVSQFSQASVYTTSDPDYKTAYGVLVKGVYTCAGSAEAACLVLKCLGYKPVHTNKGKWTHQWAEFTIKGKKAWAEGQIGYAGYGNYPFLKSGPIDPKVSHKFLYEDERMDNWTWYIP